VSLAQLAARQLETIIVMTGKDDIVTDGNLTYVAHNGHEILTKVTGTGCLLTSVVGAFAAVHTDLIEAALAAVVTYGVSAEIAFQSLVVKGPGSFQIEFLNQLFNVSHKEIEKLASFNLI
jgi:hydroxyethylthiazole kinase